MNSGTSRLEKPVLAQHALELIAAKRDGFELSREQIRHLLASYLDGTLADEQMAALLMAVCTRGMTSAETFAWTEACVDSGARLDWSHLTRPVVDKHSTGGVGDKVTLVLTPLVAHLGLAVPQLSGRGLGHTGGTLDKLEAIPGWRAALTSAEMDAALSRCGAVICAATAELAPADRRLYALRDVTATVESIPLIAASIMSKKLAEGTGSLVLDVKVGTGAFMKSVDAACELAELMVRIGRDAGVPTTALLTAMDAPLGFTAGNALEVAEAVETLSGRGPGDLTALVCRLAEEMLLLGGLDPALAAPTLASGAALATWKEMVALQGGDPEATLPQAMYRFTVTAPSSGFLHGMDAYQVGIAAWELGAGRSRKEDPVSAGAGVSWFHKPGQYIRRGEPIFVLHTDDESRLASVVDRLRSSVQIAPDPLDPSPLVLGRVS